MHELGDEDRDIVDLEIKDPLIIPSTAIRASSKGTISIYTIRKCVVGETLPEPSTTNNADPPLNRHCRNELWNEPPTTNILSSAPAQDFEINWLVLQKSPRIGSLTSMDIPPTTSTNHPSIGGKLGELAVKPFLTSNFSQG